MEPSQNTKEQYFAAKSAEDTAQILLDKAQGWFTSMSNNGYLDKLKDLWRQYHGMFEESFSDSHKITFTGEQSELVKMNVNHFRNIAQNMLVMITSTRPSMQARAVNTDQRSIVQTELANNILEYYMREKSVGRVIKDATEFAIVMGSGFIKIEWDQTVGDAYDYDPETGSTEYQGDVVFSVLSPFDVMFDSSRENQNHSWYICRSYKSKFDLAAKYPELETQILELPTKSELFDFTVDVTSYESTDLVPVYEFYHKRTEAIPDGRYMLFLSGDVVLYDGDLPYKEIPIYRISAGNILGTPYAYTPLMDILNIQEAINSLHSSILTNQNAFAVQNIWIPEGTEFAISNFDGGLNIITGKAKPEPLQLTQTPAEVFNYLNLLRQEMETITGINSVARGNPEKSLKSGSALALVQSQALQYISGLQQEYIKLIEDVGTGIINILKSYAQTPRIAAIVGENRRSEMKEFIGADLSLINRVHVDVGNPLASTTAGRVEMATNLMQYLGTDGGMTPEKYLKVINTGSLDIFTENVNKELNLIGSENRALMNNEPVIVAMFDDHVKHIKEHSAILSDTKLRMDMKLSQSVISHVNEHIDALRSVDPALLGILGMEALPPVGGSQPGPQQGQPINQSAPPGTEMMQPPQPQAANPMDQANMPNMPQPPQPQ